MATTKKATSKKTKATTKKQTASKTAAKKSGPCARVREIADSMPKASRGEVVDACIAKGINPSTARHTVSALVCRVKSRAFRNRIVRSIGTNRLRWKRGLNPRGSWGTAASKPAKWQRFKHAVPQMSITAVKKNAVHLRLLKQSSVRFASGDPGLIRASADADA